MSKQARLLVAVAVVISAGLLLHMMRRQHSEDSHLGRGSNKQQPLSELVLPAQPSRLLEDRRKAEDILSSEKAIRVQVTDSQNRPLEQATVRVLSGPKASLSLASAKTSSDGYCSIPRPDSNDDLFMEATKHGYLHLRLSLPVANTISFSLPQSTTLEAQLKDATTYRPVSNAIVFLQHPFCYACDPDQSITDERGGFRMNAVPKESRVFTVKAPGYPLQPPRVSTVSTEPILRLELVIDAGLEFSGQVVDAVTGVPVLGAQVSSESEVFTTDEFGQFYSRLLPSRDERLHLTVWADGYCKISGSMSQNDVVGPVRLLLPRGIVLRGLVREPQGPPVAAATVSALPSFAPAQADAYNSSSVWLDLPGIWEIQSGGSRDSSVSAADGSYALESLPPTLDEITVSVTCPGFEDALLRIPTRDRNDEVIVSDLVISRMIGTGRVSGQVSLNGNPVRAAVHWQGSSGRGAAWTEQGRYLLEDVEVGTISLSINLPGLPRTGTTIPGLHHVIEVNPGVELTHDFDLQVALNTISGRIHHANGAAGRELVIRYYSKEEHVEGEDRSDLSGNFALIVPDGDKPYVLSTWSANEVVRFDGVLPGTQGVDFVLPDLGLLRLEVLDSDSLSRVNDVLLAWRRSSDARFLQIAPTSVATDAQGVQEIILPVGRIDLLLRADSLGYQATQLTDLVVREAANTEIQTIQLTKGTSVSCRLESDEDELPSDVAIYLLEASAWDGLRRIPRSNGHFTLEVGGPYTRESIESRRVSLGPEEEATIIGLSPGSHRFKVFPDEITIEPEHVLVGNENLNVRLRWRRK